MSAANLKQRLAAILAADAAGYSRLMAADEHATVAALDAAREVVRAQVESNQGRVVDTAGDSVLAVFDTAAGATAAAIAIQQALTTTFEPLPEERRMRFRIGVHLGDVIEKADGSVYGDGVNIAEPVRAFRVVAGAAARPAAAGEIDLSLPDKPSIAVLPLVNMSGDPQQEYFCDGVTEDIITELSRFHSIFVIARNSTFTYKGKAVDVRTVARELGVRYVLEGSIRRAGDRIRVTGQLVDAATGRHIWAERYDRVLEDIFAVQEEVTRSIVAAIAPEIEAAEKSKARRRPGSLSAYEIAVRATCDAKEAFATSDKSLRADAMRAAREALALDPESVLALFALGHAQWQSVFFRATADLPAAWAEGMDAARRIVAVDPSDSAGYVAQGMLLCFPAAPVDSPDATPRYDEALSNLRRALELNPNDALNLHCLGYCEAVAGDLPQGIAYLNTALRNNPKDPSRSGVMSSLSMAHFLAKNYADGIAWGLKAASEAPRLLNVQTYLAMNYVGAGEIDKARAALDTAHRLSPAYIQERLDGYSLYGREGDRKRYTVFLRVAAGLEDPGAADTLR